ncbi:hypothetical protein D1007_15533 [Hordeum vulgare]|nr:hypothetical protein D1007_15533 [Hordeum vulgare]
MSRTAAGASKTRGAWDGNIVVEEHIKFHHHHRKLPSVELMAARVPEAENSPATSDGEVVVFAEHFARVFGLPMSNFFFHFVMHFGLQPHHLAANAVLQLASYITLCESFLGTEPCLDLWRQLFYFKQQSKTDGATGNKQMTAYGTALVHHRTRSGFPRLRL